MTGCIDYMLDVIEREIPSRLLDIVFKPKPLHGDLNIPHSRREIIRQEVINDWVVRDCNVLGVQDIHVPLTQATISDVGQNQRLIYFPKSSTGGKRILGISSMGFFNPYAHSSIAAMGVMTGTEMQSAISKLLSSHSQIPRVETGYVSIVNENTFMVEDLIRASNNFWVGLRLESDEYLSHIRPEYYPKLAEFGMMACKAVIYRKMINDRDGAVIEGGHELGSLNDLVNNWSDAGETYQDMRKTRLTKILRLNDKNTHRAHLKVLVS